MNKAEFIDAVKKELGIESHAYAALGIEAVLATLHERLTEGQAGHIEAHLPKELKLVWSRGLTEKLLAAWRGPRKMTKSEFLGIVQDRSHLPNQAKSERLVRGVFKTLKNQLPEGEVGDVGAQLPSDLRNLWKAA
jgi:uncharacterized protein (DUF2267 family)